MIIDLDLFWEGWNKSGYSINYPLIIRQCRLNYPLIKIGPLNGAFSFNFLLFCNKNLLPCYYRRLLFALWDLKSAQPSRIIILQQRTQRGAPRRGWEPWDIHTDPRMLWFLCFKSNFFLSSVQVSRRFCSALRHRVAFWQFCVSRTPRRPRGTSRSPASDLTEWPVPLGHAGGKPDPFTSSNRLWVPPQRRPRSAATAELKYPETPVTCAPPRDY